MSSGITLQNILNNISKNYVADINVLKCAEIPKHIQNFYLKDIESFMKIHKGVLRFGSSEKDRIDKFKNVYRGASFYHMKAREYFEFFGVNFEQSENHEEFQIPKVNPVQLESFLYSSVQMLYIVLWEVLEDFLEPLEELYFQRLSDSGVFPKDYTPFPVQGEDPESLKIDLLKDIRGRESGLYRVSEKFPFELRLIYSLSKDYYTKCFQEAEKSINSTAEIFVNDFITLFLVRNNASHIGEKILIQELSEEARLKMLRHLSLQLPSIQNSCIGIITLFRSFSKNELGQTS